MAIDDVDAAGGIGGSQLVLDVRDHGIEGPDALDLEQGKANAAAFIANPRTVAMIGPLISFIAHGQIPLTNAAGLLQCSPAATDPALTKPRDGALDLREAFPERINYIRTAPADDSQGRALASFVFAGPPGQADPGHRRRAVRRPGRLVQRGLPAARWPGRAPHPQPGR